MGLIEKLEELFNKLVFKLLEFISNFIPAPIKSLFKRINQLYASFILFIKNLPALGLNKVQRLIQFSKEKLKKENLSPQFLIKIKAFLEDKNKEHPKRGKIKNFLLMPWYLASLFFRGFSTLQVSILLTLTISSIVSIYAINKSGKDLIKKYLIYRTPASLEEDPVYDRPDYYKKNLRHVEITNLRLPVFFSNVNELKTVDIDFMITTSNRFSKSYIHKHDVQLRDHLLLNLEPIVPSLPLDDEGKEIIRDKLLLETDAFLKKNDVDGYVTDIKITYILAN